MANHNTKQGVEEPPAFVAAWQRIVSEMPTFPAGKRSTYFKFWMAGMTEGTRLTTCMMQADHEHLKEVLLKMKENPASMWWFVEKELGNKVVGDPR